MCVLVSADFVVVADLDIEMDEDRVLDRMPMHSRNLYILYEIHHNMHMCDPKDRNCFLLIQLCIVMYSSLFVEF